MAYRLIITDEGDEKTLHQVNYLFNVKCNPKAAKHLLDEIDKIYDLIEENPYQFEPARDRYLEIMGYHEAIIPGMEYKVLFRIEDDIAYVVGTFHDKEDYVKKLR